MKRIYLLSILLLILTPKVNAQEFAPLHSKWYFQYWSINSGEIVTFYSAQVDRDTTINDRYVTILSLERNDTIVPESEILLNEQNNKVYFFENDSFKLFFDFNLVAGDTLTFSVPQNYQYYDVSCGIEPEASETQLSKVKIDSVTQNNLSGQLLNVYHTSPIEDISSQYFNWNLGTVYERIGSKYGIFGYSITQCLGGDLGYFRCYSDSLIQVQNSIEECDFLLSTPDEFHSLKRFQIYPNPTINSFSFKLPIKKDVIIEVYNQLGQIQLSEIIEPTNKDAVNSIEFNLENGIYLAIFKSAGFYEARLFQVIK